MSNFTTWRSLVDGEEIAGIPDSVDYQFVASSWTEGASWDSEDGTASLNEVGSPTKQSGDLNGEDTIYLDGVDDAFENSSLSWSQPNAVVIVGRHISGSGEDSRFFDSQGSGRQILTADENGNFGIFAGSWIEDGATDSNWHIFNPLYDGASSDLRVDGTESVSGDIGTMGLDGPVIGARDNFSAFHEMEVAEIWFMSSPSASDRDDADSILNDKYGIY